MSDPDRTIAVIGGTGALGFGLALRWAKAGRTVVIGSRNAESAQKAADEARAILGADLGGSCLLYTSRCV